MIYNEIATGYFSQLEKEYNLADYMGGGLDILYMIDIMPELEVKKL